MLSTGKRSSERASRSSSSAIAQAIRPVLETMERRRLLSAGDLDPAFNGGFVLEDFDTASFADARGVAIDNDGNILVVGQSDGHIAIARYSSDGTPDSSFAGDGLLTIGIGDTDSAEGVVIRPDGQIVVTGTVSTGTNGNDIFALALNDNGTFDTSFDDTHIGDPADDGIVVYEFLNDQFATDIAVDATNTVYVSGYGEDLAFVAKLTPLGPDNTFDTDGLLDVSVGAGATIRSLLLQPGGNIVIAGNSNSGAVLARIDAVLQDLDTNFGGGGTGIVPATPHASDLFFDLARDSSGNILVGGSYTFATSMSFFQQAAEVQRYDANGNLDTDFGDSGVAEVIPTDVDKRYDTAGIAVDSQDRIVLTGAYQDFAQMDFIIAGFTIRFDATGTADSDFGTDGVVLTTISGFELGAEVTIQSSDDKIVVVGASDISFLTMRLLADDEVEPPDPVFIDEDGNLIIQGGAGADTANVTDNGGGSVSVTLNSVNYGPFTPTGEIIFTGSDGNDSITIASTITIDSNLDGGIGNDTLAGGGGNDLISGGDNDDSINGNGGNDTLLGGDGNDFASGNGGNDLIKGGNGIDALAGGDNSDIVDGGDGLDAIGGGSGRDLLIGGTGVDLILGNNDEDILIDGTTSLGDADLESVRAEWNGPGTYAQRVTALQNGGGVNLINSGAGANVFDDNVIDVLVGGTGSDWFLVNADGPLLGRDIILDRAPGEMRTDLD